MLEYVVLHYLIKLLYTVKIHLKNVIHSLLNYLRTSRCVMLLNTQYIHILCISQSVNFITH